MRDRLEVPALIAELRNLDNIVRMRRLGRSYPVFWLCFCHEETREDRRDVPETKAPM